MRISVVTSEHYISSKAFVSREGIIASTISGGTGNPNFEMTRLLDKL